MEICSSKDYQIRSLKKLESTLELSATGCAKLRQKPLAASSANPRQKDWLIFSRLAKMNPRNYFDQFGRDL